MSATRDKTQKITFVYSNLYSIYRKGVERAREGASSEAGQAQKSLAAEALNHFATGRGLDSGAVIKTGHANSGLRTPPPAPAAAAPVIQTYTPAELIGKRVARPASLPAALKPEQPLKPAQPLAPVESLKENLKSLNDLQARLRFMLQELEDLIKE